DRPYLSWAPDGRGAQPRDAPVRAMDTAREVRERQVLGRAAVPARNTTAQNRDRPGARNRNPGSGLDTGRSPKPIRAVGAECWRADSARDSRLPAAASGGFRDLRGRALPRAGRTSSRDAALRRVRPKPCPWPPDLARARRP